jgi:medium-chain acyl-[acyl-carrier-protein] hydrolase
MGAILAFELARELRRTINSQPVHLFASGRIAPQIRRLTDVTYDLTETQFVDKVREINGTPKEILEHPELMELMIPLLRADFEVVETYTYEPEAPLDRPITVLGGLQDLEVPRECLEAWREQTTAAFSVRILQGDHFFVNTAQTFIYRILTDEIYKYLR